MEDAKDFEDEREPLIDGVDSIPGDAFDLPDAPEGLEEELLRRTTSVVRANRRRRRIAATAAAVLLYAVGFGTARLVGLDAGGPGRPAPHETAETDAVSSEGLLVAEGEPGADLAVLAPGEIERRADEATPEERRRLLELAGNRFLDEQSDVEAAMRCYRNLLAVAEEREWMPDADDSWLLIALKRSRAD
jgi:hypothetical protein